MDIKIKKEQYDRLVFALFAGIGGIMIAVGIAVFFTSLFFYLDAVATEAKITTMEYYREEGEQRCRVLVSYTFDKEEYRDIPLNVYTTGMEEGKTVLVYIDEKNPQDVRAKTGLWLAPVIFIGWGSVFVGIGLFWILNNRKKEKKRKWLFENGKVLLGRIERIKRKSYEGRGFPPYNVYCTYTEEASGVIYKFKGEIQWYNQRYRPQSILSSGDSIKIYVKREDYSYYYVDAEGEYEQRMPVL